MSSSSRKNVSRGSSSTTTTTTTTMSEGKVYCGRVGERHCKCNPENRLNKITAMQVDLKMTCRKLFTDHAVYTALVMKSLVSGVDDVEVFLGRLLQNQEDIGDQLKPIIGVQKGNQMTAALIEHINLAAAVINSAIAEADTLNDDLEALYNNGDAIAEFLNSLNPDQLPYDAVQSMFRMHNQYVVDMTLARIEKDYAKELTLYDQYYNEILEMSDAIANALL
jgi:hypothetical protein